MLRMSRGAQHLCRVSRMLPGCRRSGSALGSCVWSAAIAATCIGTPARAQAGPPVPAIIEVPFAPVPVTSDGKTLLVYELHVTDFSRTPLTLMSVEVLADAAVPVRLAQYAGDELLQRLVVVRSASDSTRKNVIGAGQRAVVFLMIETTTANIPTALRHRLTFGASAGDTSHAGEQVVAHLQPLSLRVAAGDRVKAGQVLGLVGNSGNSDLPHLHFHVVNGPSPLGAEGVPYVLRSFVNEGTVDSPAAITRDGFSARPGAARRVQLELPAANSVVLVP